VNYVALSVDSIADVSQIIIIYLTLLIIVV